MNKLQVNIWDKFNKLTIIIEVEAYIKPNWTKSRVFKCKCDCWNVKNIILGNMRNWHTKSCWCLNKIHWLTHSRIHRIWHNIKNRCNNEKHKQYKDYGGRWITYDKKWENFIGFYEDMWELYNIHFKENNWNTSIDRLENHLWYSKSNCRWATRLEQNNNKRI